MGDVVDIHKPKNGQSTFLWCGCKEGQETPMLAVVIHDPQGPILSALVCADCKKEWLVTNGILCPRSGPDNDPDTAA